ncbi:MAG: peptidyl-prolyl cis-trans isomerase [Prevotellaceae bacterium]|nr:peptidyl-prolyl cis-trans isomerase [Prevotellaceae bacterium]
MRITCLCLSLVLCLGACKSGPDHGGRTPLAEIEGNFLYLEDLRAVLPAGLSKDDSLLFAENYIRNWVEDILLYEKAGRNIPDNSEIDRLVENYRKALIVHTYQQALIDQELSGELTDEELEAYYDSHQELFKAERPLIKGLFIKVPLTAPQISNVRRWYKSGTQDAVEHLEKYSLQNAVKYEYFYDKWIPAGDMLEMMPQSGSIDGKYLEQNRHIELKDTAFYYFLDVSDYRPAGEQEPFESARPLVKDMLLNMKQVEFMEQVKNDLYERARRRGRIKYYTQQPA